MESTQPCRLKVIIQTLHAPDELDFRFVNSRTKEVLELKHITKAEVKCQFEVDTNSELDTLVLERHFI